VFPSALSKIMMFVAPMEQKKTSKVVQFQVQIKVLDGYTKYLVHTSFSHVMQQGVSISEIGT
jgi:hypothetical protein